MSCGTRPITEKAAAAGKPVALRMPILPGINDTPAHFSSAKELRKRYPNIQKNQIMPYHTAGVVKWEETGQSYAIPQIPAATPEQQAEWQAAVEEAL